ncbi:FecR family protein [Sphingobacterium suaedae]|uniref:FecR family protein n=1 Tax=Sphingobacterium suaedae TaxID=1686402 RepID=A0ABW5KH17_9SPHI
MDQRRRNGRRKLNDLLQDYLREDIRPVDKQIIEDWLDKERFEKKELKKADEKVGNDVFIRIQAILDAQERVPNGKTRWFSKPIRFATAAALLVVFTGTYLLLRRSPTSISRNQSEHVSVLDSIVTRPGQRVKAVLPDSSILYLHGNSKIRYAINLNATAERKIFLDKGEAFFEVTHRPEQPFVVATSMGTNKVLGTSFNIKLRDDHGHYQLSVNKGTVAFASSSHGNFRKIVSRGHLLTYDADNSAIEVRTASTEDLSSWKDNVLIFSNNNWFQVKEKLETWFGVDLHFAGPISQNHYFTARFEKPTLAKVLKGLQHINAFQYHVKGKEVFID